MYLEAEKLNLRAPNIRGELVDEKGEKKCVPVYLVKSVNNRKGDNNKVIRRCTYVWGRITLYYKKINKTGFKDYVEDIIGSLVAAQMNVTCKRGTGSWRFTCQNRIMDKIPGLGDLIK